MSRDTHRTSGGEYHSHDPAHPAGAGDDGGSSQPDHSTHVVLRAIRWVFTLPILLYRYLISPVLPGACIYSPSCSVYSMRAIMRHGVIKGLILAITRIFRCAGGLYTGGDDPVPQRFSFRSIGRKYREFWARGQSAGGGGTNGPGPNGGGPNGPGPNGGRRTDSAGPDDRDC